jgi:hypothetical protein
MTTQQILSNDYRKLFAGVKRPGRDADHSPPSIAEVKNAWRYAYILTRLHGVVLI